jgi:hypothetical protein
MQQTIPIVTLPRKEWKLVLENGNGFPLAAEWEFKDPSVIQLENGRYRLYASVGSSVTQTWMIGMFEADTLDASWKFMGRTEIDLAGDRVCAPAVLHQPHATKNRFILDVQSECFYLPGRECSIYRAFSEDGLTFRTENQPLISTDDLRRVGYDVIGVYDAGTSTVFVNGETQEVVLFSAYRRDPLSDIPRLFGDIYMTSRPLKLVISQDHVPFHNRPFSPTAEWGVEGAKVIQLSSDVYLWVFVSFLEGEELRQRVTWATSRSLYEQPILIGVTYPPQKGTENGHSDIFELDGQVVEIRQQRNGKDGKWFFVGAQYDKTVLIKYCHDVLQTSRSATPADHVQGITTDTPVVLSPEESVHVEYTSVLS